MEKNAVNIQYHGPCGLFNPFLLENMGDALQRIIKAVNERQKIVVCGYYDLDGIAAISLIVLILKFINADVEYFIPDCSSLNPEINSKTIKNNIKFLGAKLMITVGCGMGFYSEVELCKKLGIDVIITDYHEGYDKRPDTIILNPNEETSEYPFKHLTASGVAFKLAQAISMYYHMKSIGKYLDMVMLGTISATDYIEHENKSIVEEGLLHLNSTHNYGLKALLKVHRISGSKLDINDAMKLASNILPLQNLPRADDNARIVVELLTTSNSDRAEQIAKYLKNQTQLKDTTICS